MQVCIDRNVATHLYKNISFSHSIGTWRGHGAHDGGFARFHEEMGKWNKDSEQCCSIDILTSVHLHVQNPGESEEESMRDLLVTDDVKGHAHHFTHLFNINFSPQNWHAAFKSNNLITCSIFVLTINFYIGCGGGYMTSAFVKTHRILNNRVNVTLCKLYPN